MLLKVCLPSTLGLIKEPALLDKMYSRAAMAVKGRCASNKKVSRAVRQRFLPPSGTHVPEARCSSAPCVPR